MSFKLTKSIIIWSTSFFTVIKEYFSFSQWLKFSIRTIIIWHFIMRSFTWWIQGISNHTDCGGSLFNRLSMNKPNNILFTRGRCFTSHIFIIWKWNILIIIIFSIHEFPNIQRFREKSLWSRYSGVGYIK